MYLVLKNTNWDYHGTAVGSLVKEFAEYWEAAKFVSLANTSGEDYANMYWGVDEAELTKEELDSIRNPK